MAPRRIRRLDTITLVILRALSVVAAGIVLLIIGFLVIESMPALRRIGLRRFFTDAGWNPEADVARGAFNITAIMVGSLATTVGAVLLAGPLGVLSAMYGRFYAPRSVRGIYRRLIELLAGIPSVVYGFWGLVTLVPIIRALEPPGTSLLAGILVLAIMILPTVALLADAAIGAVPPGHLRAAAALGLSRWGTATRVAIPAARGGIGIAIALATARAIGETMAVLMVCGNVASVPGSIFDPVRTLTANIALELGYAAGAHRSALFVSGLALMAMVAALVAGSGRLKRWGAVHG